MPWGSVPRASAPHARRVPYGPAQVIAKSQTKKQLDSGGSSAGWVLRAFDSVHKETQLYNTGGIALDPDTTTPYGAGLQALDGAVTALLSFSVTSGT